MRGVEPLTRRYAPPSPRGRGEGKCEKRRALLAACLPAFSLQPTAYSLQPPPYIGAFPACATIEMP